jgi:citrate lyase subunit beta/citryl-CoA lyase
MSDASHTPATHERAALGEVGEHSYRSLLFVPGNRAERFNKASASGADAVIIDLEDAVAPRDKAEARRATTAWLSAQHSTRCPVLLRVNAVGSDWFADDMTVAALPGVAGVVLAKTESAADVAAVVASVCREGIAGTRIGSAIFPLVETARGMWNALDIAQAPGVKQILFGALDFILDMNMDSDGTILNQYRSQLGLASRVAGIEAPIDGVTTSIDDIERLSAESANGRQLGLAGKLAIHPKQIAVINACYSPTEKELLWARKIVAAADRSNGAAVAVDGNMIDRPVIARATKILASGAR